MFLPDLIDLCKNKTFLVPRLRQDYWLFFFLYCIKNMQKKIESSPKNLKRKQKWVKGKLRNIRRQSLFKNEYFVLLT